MKHKICLNLAICTTVVRSRARMNAFEENLHSDSSCIGKSCSAKITSRLSRRVSVGIEGRYMSPCYNDTRRCRHDIALLDALQTAAQKYTCRKQAGQRFLHSWHSWTNN